GKTRDRISNEMIMDFMRELCNLAAGEIKSNLLAGKVAVGLSLPLITHGFDEVLFSDGMTTGQFRDWWAVDWGEGQIICSCEIDVFSPKEVARIKAPSTQMAATQDDGEIDFL